MSADGAAAAVWPRPVCNAPGPCKDWSFFCRVLDDGRVIHLVPTIYNVRLVVERPADNRIGCYTDGWCYDRSRFVEAMVACATWDGQGDPPGPWKKHVTTGRQGPGAGPADDDDEG